MDLKIRKLLLISFMLLLLLLLPLNNENNSVAAETNTNTSLTDDYSTTTSPLTIMKWAEGSNTSQQITLYYNSTANTTTWDTAQMILPENWTGYKLYTYIYELAENRSWIVNPSFNGTDTPWVSGEYDVVGYDNTFVREWRLGGTDGNGYIRVQENGYLSGSYYWYDEGDRVWYNQTFYVPRGQVVWAGLHFNYRIDSAWIDSAMFLIYVEINGQKVWSEAFPNIGDNVWHDSGLIEVNNLSLFSLPGNVTIEVGLLSTFTGGYSSNDYVLAEFDNVRLFIKALANCSDVNLKMNDLAMQDIETGKGNVTQEKTWNISPVIANFTWSPSSGAGLDSDIYVTFKSDLTLYIKKQDSSLYDLDLTATGKNLIVYNGTDVDWSFYVWVHVPSYYGNYKFNFSIPLDWNITFVAEPTTPTVNRIADCLGGNPGDGFLEVPVYLISDTPDGYWILRAKSPNYVYDVWTQVYNSATNQWENSTAFRPSNITRVVARICDASGVAPPDVTLYDANITIYFSNGTVWYTGLATPDANGYVFSRNLTIGGVNTTGDLYRVEVHWNSETEAGDLQRYFSVTHRTSLNIWNPIDAQIDLQAEAYYGDLVLLTVRFRDEDSGRLIKGATVVCNWTTGSKTLTDLGTGEYEVTLNTSELATNGRFILVITAEKNYYDSVTITLTLDIYYRTVLGSPQAPEYGIPILIGDNLTVDLYYERVDTKVGITGATITADSIWEERILYVEDTGNGRYMIYFNTTGLTAGYHTIVLNASKPFYETRSISIKFYFVYKTRYSLGGLTTYVHVGYDENFTLWFKYELYNGSPVLDANVQVYVEWLGQWLNMSDLDRDGNYTITLDVSPVLDIGNYTVYIVARKAMCQKVEVVATLQILPVPTSYFIYVTAGNITGTVIRVIEGTIFNITIMYFDTVHQIGIEGAIAYIILPNGTELALYDIGGGNYTIRIDTREFEPATYTLTLVLSKYRYKAVRETIYLTVIEKAPLTGKVLLMGALAGTGTALGLFALVASWYFYFRFPAFVRLTRNISKRLVKGKPPKFGKVKEREDIIRALIKRDYSVALAPVSLEREEIEVTVPEAEEIEEELVEAGEETLREAAEVIETLTGLPVPEELKELREEEAEEEAEREED